jgi:hypothetical protein
MKQHGIDASGRVSMKAIPRISDGILAKCASASESEAKMPLMYGRRLWRTTIQDSIRELQTD